MSPSAQITLTTPGDIIAAVPHFLGFHPTDSLVIVSLDRGTKQPLLTARVDLPPENQALPLAQQLIGLFADNNDVMLLVIGGDPPADSATCLPFSVGVQEIATALTDSGLTVVTQIWAATTLHGADCRRYDDPRTPLRVADPGSSVLAAEHAFRGRVPLSSRQQLEERVAPSVDAVVLTRRAQALHTMTTTAKRRLATHPDDTIRDARTALSQALATASTGTLPTDEHTLLNLAVSLSHPDVRDIAVVECVGDHAEAAEWLWLHLTREIPAPLRTYPATLLAIAAYVRGDGVMADVALHAALEADPGHALAQLTNGALRAAVPPTKLAELLASQAAEVAELSGAR